MAKHLVVRIDGYSGAYANHPISPACLKSEIRRAFRKLAHSKRLRQSAEKFLASALAQRETAAMAEDQEERGDGRPGHLESGVLVHNQGCLHKSRRTPSSRSGRAASL